MNAFSISARITPGFTRIYVLLRPRRSRGTLGLKVVPSLQECARAVASIGTRRTHGSDTIGVPRRVHTYVLVLRPPSRVFCKGISALASTCFACWPFLRELRAAREVGVRVLRSPSRVFWNGLLTQPRPAEGSMQDSITAESKQQ